MRMIFAGIVGRKFVTGLKKRTINFSLTDSQIIRIFGKLFEINKRSGHR